MCSLISDCILQRSAKMKTPEDSRCSGALPPSLCSNTPHPHRHPSLSHLWMWTHTYTNTQTQTHTLLTMQPGSDPGMKVHLLVCPVVHHNIPSATGFSYRFKHNELFKNGGMWALIFKLSCIALQLNPSALEPLDASGAYLKFSATDMEL